MRPLPAAALAALLLLAPAAAGAEEVSWPDAVADLAGERTRAETCARLFKTHAGGDPAALSRGALAYADAKAEMDAVISALIVAARGKEAPTALSSFRTRLDAAVAGRQAFCEQARAVLPPPPATGASRDVIGGLLGLAGEIAKVVGDLYAKIMDEDALTRETIATQVEAARWPDWKTIQP